MLSEPDEQVDSARIPILFKLDLANRCNVTFIILKYCPSQWTFSRMVATSGNNFLELSLCADASNRKIYMLYQ